MLLSLWPNFWEDWELFHKVTFDGLLKTITVTNSINDINIEEDAVDFITAQQRENEALSIGTI